MTAAFLIEMTIDSSKKPIEILYDLRSKSPELSNFDLSFEFADLFPGISSEATQSIWYWINDGREIGMEDDELDQVLAKAIRDI